MDGRGDIRSTSNSEGTYECRRDHVFLLTFTSGIISGSCSTLIEARGTYEGQSTGIYVPLGRESTIVDMLTCVLPRQALLRVWSDSCRYRFGDVGPVTGVDDKVQLPGMRRSSKNECKKHNLEKQCNDVSLGDPLTIWPSLAHSRSQQHLSTYMKLGRTQMHVTNESS